MLETNIIIIIFTAIFILFAIILALGHMHFRMLNRKISNIQSILSFLSLLIAAVTIIISCILDMNTNKAPALSAKIVDSYGNDWEDPNKSIKPYYIIDKEGHLTNEKINPCDWRVCISNSGNKTAENVMIEISLEHYYFNASPDDYDLGGSNPNNTSFKYINRIYESIPPNTAIKLPELPLELLTYDGSGQTNDRNHAETANLYVTIYEDNTIKQDFVFACNCDSGFHDFDACYHDTVRKSIVSKLDEMKNSDLKDPNSYGYPGSFDYADCKTFLHKHPKIVSSDYKQAYHYYLEKLDVYNSDIRATAKKNSVFYGRLYYMSINEKDIESKINNDTFSYSNSLP